MNRELTHQLRMNNAMFGVIAAFVGIPYLMFSLLMILLAGRFCVVYFDVSVQKELWFATVVSYGTVVAIAVTILTKGAWFKVLDIMYQDLLKAHRRHADSIKQMFGSQTHNI